MNRHGQGGGGAGEAVSGAEAVDFLMNAGENGALMDTGRYNEGAMETGRLVEKVVNAEQAGVISRGEAQVLALSAMERQNGQAEAGKRTDSKEDLALLGGERQNKAVQAAADLAKEGSLAETRDLAEVDGQALAIDGTRMGDAELGVEQETGVDQERRAIFSQERIENVVARETELVSGVNVEQAGAETEILTRERTLEDNYDIATEQGKNGREAQQILADKNKSLSEMARHTVDNMTSVNENVCRLSEIERVYSALREQELAAFGRNLGDRN